MGKVREVEEQYRYTTTNYREREMNLFHGLLGAAQRVPAHGVVLVCAVFISDFVQSLS
jgi:hypothetical protein